MELTISANGVNFKLYMNSDPFTSFLFQSKNVPVSFIETSQVVPGITCDVYEFVGDTEKDLGVVTIQPGFKTPLQQVLKGDKTIEGYISGSGTLSIKRIDGKQEVYQMNESKKSFSIEVMVGDTMQWQADKDSVLIIYEICFPPYMEGRFDNL
jgi:hypothetical protein